jgi:hypothetical protein
MELIEERIAALAATLLFSLRRAKLPPPPINLVPNPRREYQLLRERRLSTILKSGVTWLDLQFGYALFYLSSYFSSWIPVPFL